MNKRGFLLITLMFFSAFFLNAYAYKQEISVDGLFPLENSGRHVYDFDLGWRYHMGDCKNAQNKDFDDSSWEIVSVPHTVELIPLEGSGCVNYQGMVWYRKHFVVPAACKNQNVFIHFEAVMGKQEVYINGRMVKKHYGGYLPFNINLTECGVSAGDTCLIAVMADNSNDKTYPPGKPQYALDFCYHGGIYRDVWLIGKSKVAITETIDNDKVAGGSVFAHYDNISEKSADVFINTEIKNSGRYGKKVDVIITLRDKEGNVVGEKSKSNYLASSVAKTVIEKFNIKRPNLWSPSEPYLYNAEIKIMEGNKCVDGGTVRLGIRKAEFKGKKGFYLNGKPYGQLLGANRHQDFAYVGNALPNSMQWRDAKKLKDSGFDIIRTAHYPQDPSFMDACDELGLFVIVATPGWQYWNKNPEFAERVYENTTQIIRRDRNHPSVLMWEPILNETRYPLDFALKSLDLTKKEYPYPGRPVAAADVHSAGVKDNYDVVYGWPGDDFKKDRPKQCIFTREFGENVDDWYAHNNNNRACRAWGEQPMLVQAMSLAQSYDEMFRTTGQFIGGAQWHPFDHQRGYHPDPYWGGDFDAYRQPKYAYYMFKSQILRTDADSIFDFSPMVYIAHEMTQFSDSNVVVFSNCDSVKLSVYDGAKSWILPVEHLKGHMPNKPVVFKNVWDFWEARNYSYRHKNWRKVNMVAEGIINGKVVCSQKKMPSRRATKIHLFVDNNHLPVVANGSEFVVVVAEITDDNGNVRRMAKDNIYFTVEGPAEIIGGRDIGANPRITEFGTAPVLIKTSKKPGKVTVTARCFYDGIFVPSADTLTFETVQSGFEFCNMENRKLKISNNIKYHLYNGSISDKKKQQLLKKVEKQQADFGTKK